MCRFTHLISVYHNCYFTHIPHICTVHADIYQTIGIPHWVGVLFFLFFWLTSEVCKLRGNFPSEDATWHFLSVHFWFSTFWVKMHSFSFEDEDRACAPWTDFFSLGKSSEFQKSWQQLGPDLERTGPGSILFFWIWDHPDLNPISRFCTLELERESGQTASTALQ